MTITPGEIIAGISVAETLVELGLPLAGAPEFVPVAAAAGELMKKLTTLLMTHAAQAALATAVQAVNVEVDAAEAAKFGVKP